MFQVGACLVGGSDAVAVGHLASAKTSQLRKDEPHPVAMLFSRSQFGAHVIVDGLLRRNEPVQVPGVSRAWHGNLSARTSFFSIAMDTDLEQMTREQLIDEVRKLRHGIRVHRDASGQNLC